MPGMDKAKSQLGAEAFGFTKGDRTEQVHAVLGFLQGIKRHSRMVLGRLPLIMEARFFFLQMPRVRQDHRTQIDCGLRGVDWPGKPFFGQPGDPAAVVEMSVGQHHGVNIAGRNRSVFPVANPPFLGSLEQATVDEYLKTWFVGSVVTGVDEMFRSGHGSGSAKKLKVGHSAPWKSFLTANHFTARAAVNATGN